MPRFISHLILLLVGVFVLVGCDQYPGRMAVSGTVTMKGEPLKNGTVTFYPVTTGTQSGTAIEDGVFKIKREEGLLAGKYRVSISSPDGETPTNPGVAPGPSGNFTSKDRVPLAFNQNSKLEVEVTSTGPNEFEFKIP